MSKYRKKLLASGRISKKKFLHKRRFPITRLPAGVARQKKIVTEFKALARKHGFKTARIPNSAIDYHFKISDGLEVRIKSVDVKTRFGLLGENVIQIRATNRELINDADWVFAINEKKQICAFKTAHLAKYVKHNWGKLLLKHPIKKPKYLELAVELNDLFSTTMIRPIYFQMNDGGMREGIGQIKQVEFPKKIKTTKPPAIARNLTQKHPKQNPLNPKTILSNHTRSTDLRVQIRRNLPGQIGRGR